MNSNCKRKEKLINMNEAVNTNLEAIKNHAYHWLSKKPTYDPVIPWVIHHPFISLQDDVSFTPKELVDRKCLNKVKNYYADCIENSSLESLFWILNPEYRMQFLYDIMFNLSHSDVVKMFKGLYNPMNCYQLSDASLMKLINHADLFDVVKNLPDKLTLYTVCKPEYANTQIIYWLTISQAIDYFERDTSKHPNQYTDGIIIERKIPREAMKYRGFCDYNTYIIVDISLADKLGFNQFKIVDAWGRGLS